VASSAASAPATNAPAPFGGACPESAPWPSSLPGGALPFWCAHACYWAVLFLFNLLVVAALQEPKDSPGYVLLEIVTCAVVTAGIRMASKSDLPLPRGLLPRLALVGGAAGVCTVLVTIVLQGVSLAGGSGAPTAATVAARAIITFAMIGHWCALYFAYRLLRERVASENRLREAEALVLRSEVIRLQAQTNPHFLFNALNTVIACRHDPDAIETLTQALANYLRGLVQPAAALEPLARELDSLEEYLTIQAVRYGDGLVTRIDCDAAARMVPVPPLMVQSLVENAIKYGFETARPPIEVHVEARRDGDWLQVVVTNTGTWVRPDPARSTGTGIASLARRLELLLGPEAGVAYAAEGGQVRVTVRLPIGPAGSAGRSGPPA